MDDVKHARNCASELPWLACNCDGKAMSWSVSKSLWFDEESRRYR